MQVMAEYERDNRQRGSKCFSHTYRRRKRNTDDVLGGNFANQSDVDETISETQGMDAWHGIGQSRPHQVKEVIR